jgi:outer membrane receptor protein involved in Fe transport
MIRVATRLCSVAITAGLLSMVATQSSGAQACTAMTRGASIDGTSADWTGPLARPVSLHGRDVSLREALDRVAAAAKLRLSYAAELLPLSRPVCLAYESRPAGEVLAELLVGTRLRPVAAGNDQVVLSPSNTTESTQVVQATPMMHSVGVLDRVVVTGSAAGGSQRSLPIGVDIVNGLELSQRGTATLSSALDGHVPGLWLWNQSPLSLLARYGSIRGASSFGVSYPKVYVDGIEAANSLLITQLDPDAVSRVEVIRGPQGAALYGADAISGVINIVTRQEGTEGGAPRAQLRTGGGTAASEFSASSVFAGSHAAAFRAGSGTRSLRIGATATTIGAFIPDAYSRQLTANAGVRVVGARTIISGTARLFAEDARTPGSPLLAGIQVTPITSGELRSYAATTSTGEHHGGGRWQGVPGPGGDSMAYPAIDSSDRQSVRQYTVGATATFHPGNRWTHSAIAGIDGYTLRSATIIDGPFPSATDSALRAARGSAVRATLRASSVAQFGEPEKTAATVTLAAEHSWVHDRTETDAQFAAYRPSHEQGYPASFGYARSNTGLIGQANIALRDALFFSGGLRLERNSAVTSGSEYSALPMAGLAYVHLLSFATLKVRAAYGRGIRPVQTTMRAGMLMGLERYGARSTLSAEEQSGIEAGMDLFVGNTASFHLTRFDQKASGLLQPVSVTTPPPPDSLRPRRIVYELQNVGQIGNSGWELEGRTNMGRLSFSGTLSFVSSRVERIADRYSGDLRVGDRMLEVPSRTLGLSAIYTSQRWFMSWSVSRASDWINYDRIALASAFANQNYPLADFVGSQLRNYWLKYEGVTRLGGNFGYTLRRGLAVSVSGENLLDEQRGEPDNITVLPGRTVTGGIRVSF